MPTPRQSLDALSASAAGIASRRATRRRARSSTGRLLEAPAEVAVSERFAFTFDFAFGAQDVEVEMVRIARQRRVYLFVNRTRVGAPRPEFPRQDLAAAQAQLAPDEAALGVRRDPLERRVVELEWSVLSALRATCDRLAPETWTLSARSGAFRGGGGWRSIWRPWPSSATLAACVSSRCGRSPTC